jgi:Ca2+-binding RTX toxin-like protein
MTQGRPDVAIIIGTDGDDTLTGTFAADQIDGGAGNDSLSGGDGDDTLTAGTGDDLLDGGDGNDTFHVTDHRARILGGAGTDTLFLRLTGLAGDLVLGPGSLTSRDGVIGISYSGVETSDLQLRLTDADARLTISSADFSRLLVVGGSGRNSLTADFSQYTLSFNGTSRGYLTTLDVASSVTIRNFLHWEDVKFGSGNDEVRTDRLLAFDDLVHMGAGDDELRVYLGRDRAIGGAGRDLLFVNYSTETNDILTTTGSAQFAHKYVAFAADGSEARSVEFAEFETIVVIGGGGNDRLTTFDGNDDLRGGGGSDLLDGGPGNDRLDGGTGDDFLAGGPGNDFYSVDSPADVILEETAEGSDTAYLSAGATPSGKTWTLPAHVENISGGSLTGQKVRGNSLDNVIQMWTGNDFILLQDGGHDSVSGGDGNDAFYFGAALTEADTVRGGNGRDQLAIQGSYAGSAAVKLGAITEVEDLILLSGSDTRFGQDGTRLYNYHVTASDVNVSKGGKLLVDAVMLRVGESLTFDGSAETDGAFLIYAGLGVDILIGGAGNDGFLFRGDRFFGSRDKVVGGAGNDQLGLRGNYAGSGKIMLLEDSLNGIEAIVFMSGSDIRFGPAAPASNFDITMHDGNVGAAARMIIDAGSLQPGEVLSFSGAAELDGSYRIYGGAGADALAGSQNADTITGGGGGDRLAGNGGADIFHYRSARESTGLNFDTLTDFTYGIDRLDLASTVSRFSVPVSKGRLETATFDEDLASALDTVLGPWEAIRFTPSTGSFAGRHFLIVDGDGNGAYAEGADYVFELSGSSSLGIYSAGAIFV